MVSAVDGEVASEDTTDVASDDGSEVLLDGGVFAKGIEVEAKDDINAFDLERLDARAVVDGGHLHVAIAKGGE